MVMGMLVACWTMIFMITNFDSLTMWNKIIMVLVFLVALFYAVVKECIMQSKNEEWRRIIPRRKNNIQKNERKERCGVMARFIEAVKCAEIISEKFNIPLADLVDVFAEIPTADVVEVKHGKWEKLNYLGNCLNPCQHTCGVCGKSYFDDNHNNYPFCPLCGAKMDGGKTE